MNLAASHVLRSDDPRLRTPCAPVGEGYPCLREDTARLAAALADARQRLGFGRAIAAPQIGIARRFIVFDLGAGPFVVLDPRITWRSDETFEVWDDCLSLDDRIVRVRRHRSISLSFRDESLRPREWNALSPDLSELVQHEIDHLDGVLMTDRAVGDDAVQPIARRPELIDVARPTHRLSLERIAEAAMTIDPVFLQSPQFPSASLGDVLRCRLTLKVETVNPIRSFKGRGADYWVAKYVERRGRSPLVCASAGNFGQAMAYACRKRKLPITVFAANGASPLKLARMRELGADVKLEGDDFEGAKAAARTWAGERGVAFVEDGREAHLSEGAGSIAVELLRGSGAFDAVVVPLGDGALLNGMGRWIKAASPATRVIGVCARGAPAMHAAWRGEPMPSRVETIADGIAVRVPVAASVDDMRAHVDDVLLVDDEALVSAMRLVREHTGLVVEPSGAAGIAAILGHARAFEGADMATVLTGANVTIEQGRAWGM